MPSNDAIGTPLSDICLTRKETLLLLKLKKTSPLDLKNEDDFTRLLRLGLIKGSYKTISPGNMPISTGVYYLSDKGRDFLVLRKNNIFVKWIPYWVTTVIAVLAFFLSAIGLAAQLGLLKFLQG